jgi:hypothetical protein
VDSSATRFPQWDQTLTLLWFEDEEVPARKVRRDREEFEALRDEEDEDLLPELDGNLRWPGKRRRR